MPEDKLPFAAGLVNDGRAVARLLGAERAPDFFPGVLVESDNRAALSADQANQTVAIKQRVPGEAPERCFDIKVLLEVVRPEDLSLFRVEAEQIPLGTQRIDLPATDHRRNTRAGGIADGVRAFVFVFPKKLAVGFAQAQHAFKAADLNLGEGISRIADARGELAVGDIHTSLRHDWAGVARADGRAP